MRSKFPCTVPGCRFEGISQADLDDHMSRRHPKTAAAPQNEKSEEKGKTRGHPQFLPDLKGKNVIAEFLSGKTLAGKLQGLNKYEILLEVQGKKLILFKHGLAAIHEAEEQGAGDTKETKSSAAQ